MIIVIIGIVIICFFFFLYHSSREMDDIKRGLLCLLFGGTVHDVQVRTIEISIEFILKNIRLGKK